jgi:hypothetical protein
MTSVRKKSRKTLYGLIIENLEDKSKKTLKTIGKKDLFHKHSDITETIDTPNYGESKLCKPKPFKPKHQSGIPKIKHDKTLIPRDKPKTKQMYYSSKKKYYDEPYEHLNIYKNTF